MLMIGDLEKVTCGLGEYEQGSGDESNDRKAHEGQDEHAHGELERERVALLVRVPARVCVESGEVRGREDRAVIRSCLREEIRATETPCPSAYLQ